MNWEPLTALSAAITALFAAASAVVAWLMWRQARQKDQHRLAARSAALRLLVVQSDLVRIREILAKEDVDHSHIDALLEGNMIGTGQTLIEVQTFLPNLVSELRGKMMEESRHGRNNQAT